MNQDLRRIKSGADLTRADLTGAGLIEADLSRAYLNGADLTGAYLTGANIAGAIFCNANIYTTNFDGANLHGAHFSHLIVKQGPIRSDGFQYILYTSHFGGCVIRAGCRTWAGNNAFEEARQHCQCHTYDAYKTEALRILDFLEKEFKVIERLNKEYSDLYT